MNPYYGHEIPDWQAQGLCADGVYYGYRSAKELSKGAMSFNGLPLLLGHHPESADNPQKEHRIGSLGTDAEFKDSYLDNSLVITDSAAIALVESGQQVELSAAYRYEPLFMPGYFKGQAYDFIMTKIRGNHVALVEEGRAGPDVVVADENTFKKRKTFMADEENNLSLLWILKELGTLQRLFKELGSLQMDEESLQAPKEAGENTDASSAQTNSAQASLAQKSLAQAWQRDEKAEDTEALLRILEDENNFLKNKNASPDNQSANNQASDNQSANEQSANNQASDNQSANEQSANNQAVNRQASNNQAVNRQASDNQSANNQEANRQASDNQSANNQAVNRQASDNQSANNQAVNRQASDNQEANELEANELEANELSSLAGTFTDLLNIMKEAIANSGAKDSDDDFVPAHNFDEESLAEEIAEKAQREIFGQNFLNAGSALDSEALPDFIPLETVKKLLELQKKQGKEELEKHYQSLNTAAREVSPLMGLIHDPLSFDSAGQIYRSALMHAGIDPKAQPASSWRGMVQVLSHERQNLSLPLLAQDMDIAHDFTGPFAGLKNINLS